jgi:hypothetical protein
MARTPPSRVNLKRITDHLRVASRKGDRAALTLALDQMKTLALSPRYWEKYLGLLRNPLARLVDLLVIKQGERIAHQKGWKIPGGGLHRSAAPASRTAPPSDGRSEPSARSRPASPQDRPRGRSPRSNRRSPSPQQPTLFD